MIETLRIYLCGRLAIECADVAVREAELPGRQGRRVWAYLVIHRRAPVGHDELATAVWGDERQPEAWDEALSSLVSKIQALLRPLAFGAQINIDRAVGHYALQVPGDAFIDLERAKAGLHEAERLVHHGEFAPAWAEAHVAREIACRGFLPGDDLPWIVGQRQILEDVHLRAIELAAEAELRRGRPESAAFEARQLIVADPLRESGYRLLMRALAASGNRGEAARVIEECRRVLRAQADTSPSEETERLFREIVAGWRWLPGEKAIRRHASAAPQAASSEADLLLPRFLLSKRAIAMLRGARCMSPG